VKEGHWYIQTVCFIYKYMITLQEAAQDFEMKIVIY